MELHVRTNTDLFQASIEHGRQQRRLCLQPMPLFWSSRHLITQRDVRTRAWASFRQPVQVRFLARCNWRRPSCWSVERMLFHVYWRRRSAVLYASLINAVECSSQTR
jgi:hypothetical protein